MKTKSNSIAPSKDNWSSNLGVILAVSGSAVGIGNFLRFPGQVAEYGGGAFMLAYVISLILLGLPMAWMEWVVGRYGGRRGFSSPPGLISCIWKHPIAKYFGAIAAITTIALYSYYSYVESWCLGYAVNCLTGDVAFESTQEAGAFFSNFIGMQADGEGLAWALNKVGPFLLIIFIVNFTFVYRGISKGIEKFAKFAIPSLMVLALIVLIRALTLGSPNPEKPENSILNGLGFMWNPNKTYLYEKVEGNWIQKEALIGSIALNKAEQKVESNPGQYELRSITFWKQLKRAELWLAAASQVFFSLAVGFGAIMVYASYTKKEDDLVLSSLSAVSANEFCEVGLGGLISVPAAYAFLGAAGVAGQGIFSLGFNVLPLVFSKMPLGNIFGGLFFFLLFIASISGSLCMLQSGIALFEETLSIGRKRSVVLTVLLNLLGCVLVFWFSKDIKVMDTLDFWAGKFLIFTVSMVNIILFGWVMGPKKLLAEAHEGAAVKIPGFFLPIIRYVCPAFLLSIFACWLTFDVFGGESHYITDLIGTESTGPNLVAWLAVGNLIFLCFIACLLVSRVDRYKTAHAIVVKD